MATVAGSSNMKHSSGVDIETSQRAFTIDFNKKQCNIDGETTECAASIIDKQATTG